MFFFITFFTSFAIAERIFFSSQDLFLQNAVVKGIDGRWSILQDNDQWTPLTFPSYLDKLGEFKLRCEFQIDSSIAFEKIALRFNAVDGKCFVYLNGKILGGHMHGPIPFFLNIPNESIHKKSVNELIIELDTRTNFRQSIPSRAQVFGLPPIGGGIFQNVEVIYGKAAFLDSILIESSKNEAAYQCSFYRNSRLFSSQPDRYTIQIFEDQNGNSVWQKSVQFLEQTNTIFIEKSLLRPWGKGDRQRYRMGVTRNKTETITCKFGFSRFFEKSETGDEKHSISQMKMIEWVYDKDIRRLPENELKEIISSDILAIKRLGADAVRVLAGLPPEYFLDKCDSLGLEVLLELPLLQTPPLILDDQFFQQCSTVLREMVNFAGKHPSVIAWGLGNGYDLEHKQTQKFIQRMTDFVRSLDDRPVYIGVSHQKIADPSAVDFIIVDVHVWKNNKLYRAQKHRKTICRVVSLIPLVGHTVQEAEREQAFSTSMDIKRVLDDYQTGVCIGPLRDWRGDMPNLIWGPRKQPFYFYAGLLDRDGNPRPVFNIIQSNFLKRESNIILPLDGSHETRYVFQVMGFIVLLVFLIIFKSDRRLRKYLNRIFLHPHGFYTDLCENRRVIPSLTFIVGSTAFLTCGIVATSFFYFLRTNLVFDTLLNWMVLEPWIKLKLIWFIWHPVIFVFVLTILFFTFTILNSAFIKVIVYFQNRYLRWWQIITLFLWIPANFLFFLPVSIIFYRILGFVEYRTVLAVLVGLFFLWFVVRFYRGIKVVLQLSRMRAILYLCGFLLTGFLLLVLLEYSRAFSAYAPYYLALLYN
ncbi:hypothetical protein JW935_03350 [candidate division KSB1 bacterium]|nr:hypothetical protein [candidate division KSB1 bacterium]